MMNGPKRSYSITKNGIGRCNGKLKDILSSSRHKSEGKVIEPDLANIPVIKQTDNPRLLPKYTTILAKLGDEGVSMDDLDPLQQDLEKLLSTSAVRIRYLLAEIGEIDRSDDINARKAYDKTSLKRKRPDEKPKFKDLKNGFRAKKNYGIPVNRFINDPHLHQEIPKVTLPENDNSDKFWASTEPYCTNVNRDDVAFLDSLIQEFSKEIDIKIPDVGEHYSSSWTEEILNDDQKSATRKLSANTDIKKNGLQVMVETFSTPHTQRLLAALIEERILNDLPKNGENGAKTTKLKFSELTKLKPPSANQKVGTCLDRRLKKELVEQGILTLDDLTKSVPEDEILTEIKKCQQELGTVNEYNIEELNKLRAVVYKDMRANELKDDLAKIDQQVLDLYNKTIITRKAALDEGEEITKEFEAQADALLKQQIQLNRELNGLTDMQMLY